MSARWTERRRAELAVELEQLAAQKSAWWDALRQANDEGCDGKRMSRLLAESAIVDERAERLRRIYFPRAGKLCVVSDETIGQAATVFTMSPRGRSIRTVWTGLEGLVDERTAVPA